MAKKVQPVAFVARDYIVLADGTRYERDEKLPPEVAKRLPDSFKKEKPDGVPGR